MVHPCRILRPNLAGRTRLVCVSAHRNLGQITECSMTVSLFTTMHPSHRTLHCSQADFTDSIQPRTAMFTLSVFWLSVPHHIYIFCCKIFIFGFSVTHYSTQYENTTSPTKPEVLVHCRSSIQPFGHCDKNLVKIWTMVSELFVKRQDIDTCITQHYCHMGPSNN